MGMPALPTLRIMVLRFSICCSFFGPSSNTSCQCAGSKFSMASSSSPASLIFFDHGKLLISPELVGVAPQAPAGVVADGLVAGLVAARGAKIVHQMNDEGRATALPGKTIMFRVELMPIKTEPEFHLEKYCGFHAGSKTSFERRG